MTSFPCGAFVQQGTCVYVVKTCPHTFYSVPGTGESVLPRGSQEGNMCLCHLISACFPCPHEPLLPPDKVPHVSNGVHFLRGCLLGMNTKDGLQFWSTMCHLSLTDSLGAEWVDAPDPRRKGLHSVMPQKLMPICPSAETVCPHCPSTSLLEVTVPWLSGPGFWSRRCKLAHKSCNSFSSCSTEFPRRFSGLLPVA